MSSTQHAVTRALASAASGDHDAANLLWQLTYEELHRIAERHLYRERGDHTLSATALVHEAYVRLIDQTRVEWKDRGHFFAVASQACRRILVDYARKRHAQKRGGAAVKVTLDTGVSQVDEQTEEILALHEALERLGEIDERLTKLVELRYFGGLSEEETAESLGVSARTVRRDWVKAKAWLYNELFGDDEPAAAADPTTT
jgi:RNA polymerase sigma factor (TIGR02999 family)